MNKRKLIGFLFFAVFFLILGKNISFIPKLPANQTGQDQRLKNEVKNITKNKAGFYSVYFKDFKTNEQFGIDEHQIQTAASVNKIPIVAVLYYLASRNEISLDDKITIQEKDVQDYGTGSIRYQKMPQAYSLRNLAKLTLKQSDNTAAHVLGVKIGTDKIQKIINSWGLSQTDMAKDKSTLYDMEIVFEKIYKGQIANPALTKELLNFMTESDFEDRLSKDLPSNINVYHKTGDAEGFVHDVGIIESANGAYFLGVMTSDIGNNEQQAKATIAEISKKIYELVSN